MLVFRPERLVKMNYISRWLEQRIKDALTANPVVVLTGPRQVGKSTLLENADFLKDWRYLTLDDPDIFEQAQEDPKGLLLEDKPTIIDEIQRAPELLLTIKYFVDKSQRHRNFILSGSGNVSLRNSPRESLAGRAQYLYLTGLSFREFLRLPVQGIFDQLWQEEDIKPGAVEQEGDLINSVWRGSLPGVLLASTDKIAIERMGSYVDTYIQRDIHDLVRVRYPQNFRRLMETLAQATGWESVQDDLSSACGETRSNVSRYMSLLKDTKILFELKGYAGKRERAYKQSKFYWFDSGMACYLSGINEASGLREGRIRGRYVENFIFQQILSWMSMQLDWPELFYWKPKAQEGEVDFVVRHRNKIIGIEVKSSENLNFSDTRSMRNFLKTHPEASRGVIVYSGNKIYPISTGIYAVPWMVF